MHHWAQIHPMHGEEHEKSRSFCLMEVDRGLGMGVREDMARPMDPKGVPTT